MLIYRDIRIDGSTGDKRKLTGKCIHVCTSPVTRPPCAETINSTVCTDFAPIPSASWLSGIQVYEDGVRQTSWMLCDFFVHQVTLRWQTGQEQGWGRPAKSKTGMPKQSVSSHLRNQHSLQLTHVCIEITCASKAPDMSNGCRHIRCTSITKREVNSNADELVASSLALLKAQRLCKTTGSPPN